jgi:tyrosyl-tRNA synthetase
MTLKGDLARLIVRDFHGEAAAHSAAEHFARVHRRGELPDEMQEFQVPRSGELPAIVDLLVQIGLAPSKTEARRLVKAGAVSVDGQKITDVTAPFPGQEQFVLRCGRLRFCRIRRV